MQQADFTCQLVTGLPFILLDSLGDLTLGNYSRESLGLQLQILPFTSDYLCKKKKLSFFYFCKESYT